MTEMKLALIIEDDPEIGQLIKEVIIEQSNLWPVVVRSCEEASRFVMKEDVVPAFVFVDYDLCGRRYEKLIKLREAREERQNEAIPMLITNKEVMVGMVHTWSEMTKQTAHLPAFKKVAAKENRNAPAKKGEETRASKKRGFTQERTE